jgi:hypothetical protein
VSVGACVSVTSVVADVVSDVESDTAEEKLIVRLPELSSSESESVNVEVSDPVLSGAVSVASETVTVRESVSVPSPEAVSVSDATVYVSDAVNGDSVSSIDVVNVFVRGGVRVLGIEPLSESEGTTESENVFESVRRSVRERVVVSSSETVADCTLDLESVPLSDPVASGAVGDRVPTRVRVRDAVKAESDKVSVAVPPGVCVSALSDSEINSVRVSACVSVTVCSLESLSVKLELARVTLFESVPSSVGVTDAIVSVKPAVRDNDTESVPVTISVRDSTSLTLTLKLRLVVRSSVGDFDMLCDPPLLDAVLSSDSVGDSVA